MFAWFAAAPEQPAGKGKFGFRAQVGLFCALVALVLLSGWVQIFRLQAVAQAHQQDPFFLALRCFEYESERTVYPLVLLDPEGKVARTAQALRESSPVPPEQLRAAQELLAAGYDLSDRDTAKHLQDWGAGLFALGTIQARMANNTPSSAEDLVPATESQATVMAAVLLRGVQTNAARDLPRLQQLAEQAIPEARDRAAALAWAEGLYDQMAVISAERSTRLQETGKENGSFTMITQLSLPRTLPPRTTWTLWWLVYQHVGLDDASRRAAANTWPQLFAGTSAARARAYGERIERERRSAADPLPPASAALPWVCLIHRYQGLDPAGASERTTLREAFDPNQKRLITNALTFINPSDDFFYLFVSEDPLHLLVFPGKVGLAVVVVFALVAIYGSRVLLFSLLAEFVLRLHHNEAYRAYRDGRGHGSMLGWLFGYVAIPLLGWGIALLYLPDHLAPLAGTPASMLFATALALVLGGTFLGVVTRLVAILLLRLGVNIERLWYDEFIGLAIGLPLLWYLGNDAIALALIVAAELVPLWLQPRQRPALPDENPTGAPAAT